MCPASIVIPTRGRPGYLQVALESLCEQARSAGAELLVIADDVESARERELAERAGARYHAHGRRRGLNAARNTGVALSRGDLVVFVDDDIRARPGWLAALTAAAEAEPEVEVFTGPVRASLEGPAPRSCGREGAPVTTLELGTDDTDTAFAWGANMAIRRTALERVGPFDEGIAHGGDEQEWQERLRAQSPGARVRYIAAAAVEHRRAGTDARLRSLCRTAWVRGRAARRFERRGGRTPSLRAEARTLAGCLGHVLRRRCPAGMTMVAHSCGRLFEAIREAPGADAGRPDQAGGAGAGDFLSGSSGTVGGLGALRRGAADAALDAVDRLSGSRRRLERAASSSPPAREVLVLSVEREQNAALARAARAELVRSRHHVHIHTGAPQGRGKFENLNALLASHPAQGHDWLIVIDDDVELPRGFLDRLLFLCERFSLALAQPAHRLRSHAAWPVTRRRAGSIVRESAFVEIGPVTAFAAVTFPVLLPFPELRMGWGLDAHWAALAREHGWRCGILDAVAISHRAAPAAAAYSREAAIAEAQSFLAQRPYLTAREAGRTLATHRRW